MLRFIKRTLLCILLVFVTSCSDYIYSEDDQNIQFIDWCNRCVLCADSTISWTGIIITNDDQVCIVNTPTKVVVHNRYACGRGFTAYQTHDLPSGTYEKQIKGYKEYGYKYVVSH